MALVAAAPAGAQAPVPEDRLIRLVDNEPGQVGDLRLGRDLRLVRAVRAYGWPGGKRGSARRGECTLRWRRDGITVHGVTLSTPPRRRCHTRVLSIQQVSVDGAGWTTDRGLAIGDPASRIDELYGGGSELEDGRIVLELQDDVTVPDPTPQLLAVVGDDKVLRLDVYVGGAGE